MSFFTPALQEEIEAFTGSLRRAERVGGSVINQAARLQTGKGEFFVKYNSHSDAPDILAREAEGLSALREPGVIRVPEVVGHGVAGDTAFLILPFLTTGAPGPDFWHTFGRQLAELHRHTHEQGYGFPHDNYIGSLPQANDWIDDWPDFYAQRRLLPQWRMACDAGRFSEQDRRDFDRLLFRLPDLLEPTQPALIHGDLWNGNYLVSEEGQPVLIDPATSYASREMDLAMSRLFGGFERSFYEAYEKAWPLPRGAWQRVQLYQLYYVLVHVNLFGGGYVESARRIVKRYV